MEISNTVLPIHSDYQLYLKVIIPILTIYCGLFMAISNHYVLKPKIQTFLHKASISSNVIQELIIDFLSSLSLITLLLSSVLLTPTGDQPLTILAFHDIYWLTICCAVLLYWKISEQQSITIKIAIKNIIFLLLCYVNTLYHYFSQNFYFTLGLVYIGLYLLNLLINSYEERFISFVNQLFGLKTEPQKIPFSDRTNKLPSYSYLAENYPITKSELQEKMNEYEKKVCLQKINTKVFATKKLLQMVLAISLSKKKLERDQKQYVYQYFGFMNGTIRKEVKGNSYISHNLKQTKKDKVEKFQEKENQEEELEQSIITLQDADDTSVLFYIFPVKLFESSKIISTVFSVFINLGFGLLVDFCDNITNTLQYGSYFHFVYALLLLPILPKIAFAQYFNNMVLFSLWKYCLVGIIYSSSSSMNGLTWTWKTNAALKYHTLIQALCLLIASFILLYEKKSYKVLIILFFVGTAINIGLVYFQKYLP